MNENQNHKGQLVQHQEHGEQILTPDNGRIQECVSESSVEECATQGNHSLGLSKRDEDMKSVLFVTLALAFSSPALAADQPSKTSQHMQAMADKLNDPKAQAAMVGGLDAMMAALMDIRVDGIAKALEPLNGGKKIKMKGDTLRDIAAKDDRDFDKKLHKGTKTMVAGVGAMSSALAAMMPALEEAMEKMDEEMAKVADKLPETR